VGIISFGRRPLPGLKLYSALRFWYYCLSQRLAVDPELAATNRPYRTDMDSLEWKAYSDPTPKHRFYF
jgi:hypothetical protein